MKKTILVDMDGVVADFVGGIIEAFEERGIHFDRTNIDSFTYTKWTKEHADVAKSTFQAPGFFRKLALEPGAVEAIMDLRKKYNVRFCSSPLPINETCEPDKRAWIEEYFGRQMAEEAYIDLDKTLCAGDVLVDDNPKITGAQKPAWQHIVFDQTWNQESSSPRLMGWGDVGAIESVLAPEDAKMMAL